MMRTVSLSRDEVLTAIADAAYLVADVEEGKECPHRLHQTFDICEEENLPRTNRLVDLAFTEARLQLLPLQSGSRPDIPGKFLRMRLSLPGHSGAVLEGRIREVLREFIVAQVLSQWLSVTLPASAGAWRRRGEELTETLKEICAAAKWDNTPVAFRRSCCPF